METLEHNLTIVQQRATELAEALQVLDPEGKHRDIQLSHDFFKRTKELVVLAHERAGVQADQDEIDRVTIKVFRGALGMPETAEDKKESTFNYTSGELH